MAIQRSSKGRPVQPEVITLPYKFEPREYQYPVLRYYDEMPNRQRAFLLAHRRTGKDLLAWNILIKESQKRVGTYWHVLPLLNQARKIIWTGSTKDGVPFLDFIPPPLIVSKRDDDMSIRLTNGSLIQLVGADRIDSLMGSNPVGVNLSEFALMKPSVWDYLSPILNENDGWANFITTPRGRNHAFDLFKSMVDAANNKGAKYFIQVLTVEDTRKPVLGKDGTPVIDQHGNPVMVPVIPPEAIQEQRDLNVPEEIIQQEYYCFKPDTLITTARGQIPIVDVRRGDVVLTHANRMRKVLDTIVHHHIGDMVRIKSYGNGKDLVCTPNHPVRVYNKSTQSYEWRPAEVLQKGDRIICFHRSARMHSAIREVSREHYDGLVYNLSVQYDESYVADGRVVHNCSFEAGMVGAYYSEAIAKLEKEGRATKNPQLYDASKEVYTAWDIGFSDSMSIWYFQIDENKINVIEYNEFVGRSLIECCHIVLGRWNELRDECGWSDDQVSKTMALYQHHELYKYKTHFGPHDLDQTDISIGVTRRSVAKQHGVKFKLVPRTDVQSGIDLVRRLLINVYFDLLKTNDGVRALKEYHKQWNEDKQMYEEKPCHDWSSHGADGFRYLAQAVVTYINKKLDKPQTDRAEFKHDPLEEKIRRYAERDDEDEKPKGHLRRSRMEQLAQVEYDLYEM